MGTKIASMTGSRALKGAFALLAPADRRRLLKLLDGDTELLVLYDRSLDSLESAVLVDLIVRLLRYRGDGETGRSAALDPKPPADGTQQPLATRRSAC